MGKYFKDSYEYRYFKNSSSQTKNIREAGILDLIRGIGSFKKTFDIIKGFKGVTNVANEIKTLNTELKAARAANDLRRAAEIRKQLSLLRSFENAGVDPAKMNKLQTLMHTFGNLDSKAQTAFLRSPILLTTLAGLGIAVPMFLQMVKGLMGGQAAVDEIHEKADKIFGEEPETPKIDESKLQDDPKRIQNEIQALENYKKIAPPDWVKEVIEPMITSLKQKASQAPSNLASSSPTSGTDKTASSSKFKKVS
jgi:hypothetical protein